MSESYPYEQLDGRRFQRLAQALLLAEDSRVQCFPISGQDGGRDASLLTLEDPGDKLVDSVIYQVKFREPTPMGVPTGDDLYKWVISNLNRELPKLLRLQGLGAREYLFITNVAASGHPGVGLRDKVKTWAEENLPLPCRFWWRDDLDARLDNNHDLVFRFSLFTGPAAVRAYFESPARADGSNAIKQVDRSGAVSALLLYLDDQYESDSKLRFKQADLDSTPILDFFVDVPLSAQKTSASRLVNAIVGQTQREAYSAKAAETQADRKVGVYATFLDSDRGIGAADFFLGAEFPPDVYKFVLEGAPGQGKSTLTQYLGQVYRAIILDKKDDLAKIPAWHKSRDLRLPIRIELRRLAMWLRGESPWKRAGEKRQETSHTLQEYIADHIRHVTAMSFNVDDLIAIISATPTLLLLDGLDEVADIGVREEVVKCCDTFIKRIAGIGGNLKVLATSRPAAFSKSPAFSRDDYAYFSLNDLTPELIEKYRDSWIKLRAVPADQARELRQVLTGSLAQSHVADLARNPMQLAILIWLVYVKGWSLPDKRTALYEAYMSTFLDREADKSPVVRRHRDILMELHGFLGWMMHARSEQGSASGAGGDMADSEIKDLLRAYLEAEERPTELVEQLFHGVERVFVLVARIQGRFEFEVQPLREFFAARYLYKTSPHSTSAFPVAGTRPDRLEALIRNPYWLNVARFFCGWYDKGELADLSRRLEDLCSEEDYGLIGHPRQLIVRLLGDYVTTASRRDTHQLAELLTTPLAFRLITLDSELGVRSGGVHSPLLPYDAGQTEFVESAYRILKSKAPSEQIQEAAITLARQGRKRELGEWWLQEARNASDISDWVSRGATAGALERLEAEELWPLIAEQADDARIWESVVAAGRIDLALTDPLRMANFMTAVGHGVLTTGGTSALSDYCRILTRFVSPEAAEGYFYVGEYDPKQDLVNPAKYPEVSDEIDRLNSLLKQLASRRTYGDREHFDAHAESIREFLGECWAAWRPAIVGAPVSKAREAVSFSDAGHSLYSRVATAWQERENAEYWRTELTSVRKPLERSAILTCLALWGHPKVIKEIPVQIYGAFADVTQNDLRKMLSLIFRPAFRSRPGAIPKIDLGTLEGAWESLPASFVSILHHRVRVADLKAYINGLESAARLDLHDDVVSGVLVGATLKWMSRRADWKGALDRIIQSYPTAFEGAIYSWGVSPYELDRYPKRFPDRLAREILGNPSAYPAPIIRGAEAAMSGRVTARIRTMRQLADDESWFSEGVG